MTENDNEEKIDTSELDILEQTAVLPFVGLSSGVIIYLSLRWHKRTKRGGGFDVAKEKDRASARDLFNSFIQSVPMPFNGLEHFNFCLEFDCEWEITHPRP